MKPPRIIAGRLLKAIGFAAALCLLGGFTPTRTHAQGVNTETMERGRKMLAQIRKDLKEFYYDTTYQGLDLDAGFERADSAIRSAKDNTHMLAIIAQYVSDFKDSHTRFIPPSRVARVDYGFGMTFVGESLFVTLVKRGSDAEKKGLKRGDLVLQFEAFKPERQTFHIVEYVYFTLSPRPLLRLQVKPPDAAQRQIDIEAKITMGERIIDFENSITRTRLIDEYESAMRRPDHYYTSIGDSVMIWRMPSFSVSTDGVDDMMKRVRKHRSLILDLRNNGGGLVSTMLHLVGHFFDRDLKVFDLKTRKESKAMVAKARSKDPFRGMLVVLVNSNSASASEITARMAQLEGRAIVVGDRTMGAVVTSIFVPHEVGFERVLNYGLSVSVSDVVMPDGKRLENIGVTPDHLVLPTAADLAAQRDPAMSKALSLAGVTMSPEDAGWLFRAREKTGKEGEKK